jgi:2'-5' RNA ligase
MRLFIAITLSETIKLALQDLQTPFRLRRQRGNFTTFNNLHLTLVFIGECSIQETEVIESILEEVKGLPFELTLGELGNFIKRDGEIWWVGIKPNPYLNKLQANITKVLRENDISFEDKKYVPHLTLVRNYKASTQETLLLSQSKPLSFKVNSFSLMKSERFHDELQYTEIAAFNLNPDEKVL